MQEYKYSGGFVNVCCSAEKKTKKALQYENEQSSKQPPLPTMETSQPLPPAIERLEEEEEREKSDIMEQALAAVEKENQWEGEDCGERNNVATAHYKHVEA